LKADKINKWVKRRNLIPLAKKVSQDLTKVFSECLGIKKDQNLLIIGDTGLKNQYVAPTLAYAYYIAAQSKKLKANIVFQKITTRGQNASKLVQETIKKLPQKSVIILSLSDRLGKLNSSGKSFRKFVQKNKHRFVSTTSLSNIPTKKIKEVIKAIDIDYGTLRKRQAQVKALLDKAKEVYVTSPAGTELYFSIKDYKAISADAFYNKPGEGGNLPAGEVYIVPNNMQGMCVIDASSRNRFNTHLTKKPIKLVIKDNRIEKIIDGSIARLLEKSIKWAERKAKYPERIRQIAEFGIGLNKDAGIIGTTIIDEKAYGTAHIALGSNYWFKGPIKTIIHLDQVFRNPKIRIDGKLLRL